MPQARTMSKSAELAALRKIPDRPSALADETQEAVDALVRRARKRQRGALVRNSFVRGDKEHRPPLAALAGMKGRGGGRIALKLYLSLLLLSAAEPHRSDLDALTWAQVLGLPDSETNGAVRVRRALKTLETLKLITIRRRRGQSHDVVLLHESGSGRAYSLPRGQSPNDRYFSLPSSLWTKGLINEMSTAALAMLLILIEEARNSTEPEWWSPRVFAERFHISPDTRTKGTKELRNLGLILETSERLPTHPGPGAALTSKRRRKSYTLLNEARAAVTDR